MKDEEEILNVCDACGAEFDFEESNDLEVCEECGNTFCTDCEECGYCKQSLPPELSEDNQ